MVLARVNHGRTRERKAYTSHRHWPITQPLPAARALKHQAPCLIHEHSTARLRTRRRVGSTRRRGDQMHDHSRFQRDIDWRHRRLSLSLSLSQKSLTHNIGSASALPIIGTEGLRNEGYNEKKNVWHEALPWQHTSPVEIQALVMEQLTLPGVTCSVESRRRAENQLCSQPPATRYIEHTLTPRLHCHDNNLWAAPGDVRHPTAENGQNGEKLSPRRKQKHSFKIETCDGWKRHSIPYKRCISMERLEEYIHMVSSSTKVSRLLAYTNVYAHTEVTKSALPPFSLSLSLFSFSCFYLFISTMCKHKAKRIMRQIRWHRRFHERGWSSSNFKSEPC